MRTIEEVCGMLESHQGEPFRTAKGLPFTYKIRGGELFVDRRRKSITVSTVSAALEKIGARQMAGEIITGPKMIGCYGASYLFPIFLRLGIIEHPEEWGQTELLPSPDEDMTPERFVCRVMNELYRQLPESGE